MSGQKGRTVVENPEGGRPSGGFIKGATLLESGPASPSPSPAWNKSKTVFDPGPSVKAEPSRAAPAKLIGWLVSFTLTSSGDDFRLREGRNIVGSDADCDVVVRDPSVSSKHAVIIARDGVLQLRDNDSTNGTYVNNQDTFGKGAVTLANLDSVRLGRVECVLYALRQE